MIPSAALEFVCDLVTVALLSSQAKIGESRNKCTEKHKKTSVSSKPTVVTSCGRITCAVFLHIAFRVLYPCFSLIFLPDGAVLLRQPLLKGVWTRPGYQLGMMPLEAQQAFHQKASSFSVCGNSIQWKEWKRKVIVRSVRDYGRL
jgi:hypothetical protein